MNRVKRFFSSYLVIATLIILVTIVAASSVALYLRSIAESELSERLELTLTSSVYQLKQVLQSRKNTVSYWAKDGDVINGAQGLNKATVSYYSEPYRSLNSKLTAVLEAQRYRDYKFLDKRGVVLFSGNDILAAAGEPLDIPSDTLASAWNGDSQISPPLQSSRAWEGEDGIVRSNESTMLALAAVKDATGQTVVLLAFEFDPDLITDPIFHYNQVGETGRSYAINQQGLLLTKSKHSDQIEDLGLLTKPNQDEALQLFVKDPGVNLLSGGKSLTDRPSLPLTVMAQSISLGLSGSNIDGYNDFRGVPVVGAWLWDDELKMGIVTESDVSEAYHSTYLLIGSIFVGVLTVVILTFIILMLFHRSQQRYSNSLIQRDAVFDHIADGIITINEHAIITMVNPVVITLFGYNESELLGQNVSMIMPEEIAKEHDSFVRKVNIDSSQMLNTTLVVEGRRKDGSQFPLELIVSPMVLDDGVYFSATLRDISDRTQQEKTITVAQEKEKEISLQLKERARELIFQTSALDEHALVSMTDVKGNIIYANEKFCRISGYREEEMLGKNHRILNSHEHPKAFFDDLWHTVANGKPWHGEVKNKAKDGSYYWVQATIIPFMNEEGKPERYVSIRTDITHQKQLEVELKENEARLSLSQEFANIGTWEWNIETGDLFWSDHVAVLFGGEKGILETSYEAFIGALHPDDVAVVTEKLEESVKFGSYYDVEHRVVWPDGSIKWIQEKGNIIRDAEGKPLRMLGIAIDIDHVKITQLQLEKASKAKSDFLSSMSHELRTPLNAILGFSQLLQSDIDAPLTNDQSDSVEHIYSSGKHLLELINQVLELSRIEAGKLEISLEVLRIQDIFDLCLPMLQTQADKNNVSLQVISREKRDVVADFTRLKQVVINLVSNAIKYNKPQGSVSISYELVRNGTMLRVTVKDTGWGIAAEKQDLVFHEFNRLGQESSDIEGTGIGLVITKRIITAMDGDIGFSSIEGEGSHFWFELPISNNNESEELLSLGGEDNFQAETVEIAGDQQTVLYVEDNPTNIRLVKAFFGRYRDCQLRIAESAEDALLQLEQQLPTVILMDINLPGLSGLEATTILKNRADFNVPIIGVSAAAMQQQVSEAEDVFDHYLTKPVDFMLLAEMLGHYGIYP